MQSNDYRISLGQRLLGSKPVFPGATDWDQRSAAMWAAFVWRQLRKHDRIDSPALHGSFGAHRYFGGRTRRATIIRMRRSGLIAYCAISRTYRRLPTTRTEHAAARAGRMAADFRLAQQLIGCLQQGASALGHP